MLRVIVTLEVDEQVLQDKAQEWDMFDNEEDEEDTSFDKGEILDEMLGDTMACSGFNVTKIKVLDGEETGL